MGVFQIAAQARAMVGVAALCLAASSWTPAHAADTDELKSFGTMGKEQRLLQPGAEAELFRYSGKGCLTHMWFGGNFRNYGLTHVRIYVDHEKQPSIDMELMMGHGIGFQDESAPWGVERIGKTGQPSGIYNTYRIPFGRSVRVTAERSKDEEGNPPFWWIIRGVENLGVELGGIRLPDTARLRLYRVENRTAKPLEEFDLYNGQTSGAVYQVAIAARSSNFCFLESCVRAYIGGSESPLMLSSGLEDYFLYRFHETEPVFFRNGLRLTIRNGEEIAGKVFGPQPGPAETVYTTYAWVYEW